MIRTMTTTNVGSVVKKKGGTDAIQGYVGKQERLSVLINNICNLS